jgi:hypothetical protein
MQSLEKVNKISQILNDIVRRNVLYADPEHRTYFSYDEVIEHLESALNIIDLSARNPRPNNIPQNISWNEKFYSPDNEFNPYVYDGSMSPEDFERAADAYINNLDEMEMD